ncbi:di-heme oxidoreductase [Aureococcus anophagefferens]|nr:di-heme oxidoreductase [Aureococcus anophagefferens]
MGALRRARALLGATRSTDEEQLRKLYRKHALKTHPDKPGGDIEAFQRVASAYELCRAHLGQSLTAAEWAADDRPTEYYDPNDRGRKSQRPAARRPDDAIDPFEVFSDAFRGWAESAEFQQWAVDAFGDDFDQLDITFQWGVDDQYVEVARERSLVKRGAKIPGPAQLLRGRVQPARGGRRPAAGLMDVVLRMGADRSPPVHVFRDLARSSAATPPRSWSTRGATTTAGDLAPPPRCAVVRLCVDDCVDGDGRPALAYGVADVGAAPDWRAPATLSPRRGGLQRARRRRPGRVVVFSQSGGPGNADDVVVAKTLRESRVLHQDPTVLEGGANLWDHLRNPRSSLIYVVRKGGAIVRRGASLQSDFVAELEEGADLWSIRNYTARFGAPDAVMSYASIGNLSGLWSPTDYGSGVEYADGALAGLPARTALQLGLELKGHEAALAGGDLDANVDALVAYVASLAPRHVLVRIGYEFDMPGNLYVPEAYKAAYRVARRVVLWSYIDCDWDSQPMWRGMGWGDSRLEVRDALAAKWEYDVLDPYPNATRAFFSRRGRRASPPRAVYLACYLPVLGLFIAFLMPAPEERTRPRAASSIDEGHRRPFASRAPRPRR